MLQLENTSFFLRKLQIIYSQASMRAVEATGEAFNPQREHPALENRNVFYFFYFVGLSADQNQC
jgi:hypothetical protein